MSSLDEEFGPSEEIELEEVSVTSNGEEKDLSSDYALVREKIILSIVRSTEVIDAAVRETKSAASPRAIEAAAASIKTIVEASKTLLEVHDKMKSMENKNESKDSNTDEVKATIKTSLKDLISEINSSGLVN